MRKSNPDEIAKSTGSMTTAASQLSDQRLDAFFKFYHLIRVCFAPRLGLCIERNTAQMYYRRKGTLASEQGS
jgi:hypothetical protein